MSDNKKNKDDKKPKVHKDLGNFEFKIDSFGEVSSNLNIDKINDFLDKNVEDKKIDNDKLKDKKKKKD